MSASHPLSLAILSRLGLLHLKDDPETLLKETKRRIAEFDRKAEQLRINAKQRRQSRLPEPK